jgi:serine/threonine protein kinase
MPAWRAQGVLCRLGGRRAWAWPRAVLLESRKHASIRVLAMTRPAADARHASPNTPGADGAPRRALPGELADALPTATRLHEFEILSVIGQGGFGIVYLARDLALERHVAIKEYMPSALARRTQAMTVAVRSNRHTETFAAGLRSFINEARLLARFDHPSLLKVHRFWEAHGTAYMVMPYYEGTTLAQRLAQPGGPPDEAWLRALLDPVLDALAQMHAAHCYHRDIAPDNILLLPGGMPLLLDFGAARHVIVDMSQAPTVILKPGYAPVEQYGDVADMTQGPWTDLYALGSVVEFAVMGRTPPQALTRFLADKREPLAVTAAGRYSDAFLRAIDRALAVLPKDRPQNVADMRALLGAAPAVSVAADDPDVTVTMPAALVRPSPRPTLRPTRTPVGSEQPATAPPTRWRGIGTAVAIAIAALTGVGVWFTRSPPPVPGTASPPAPGTASPSAADVSAPPAPQIRTVEPAAQAPAPPLVPSPSPSRSPSPSPSPLRAPPPAQSPAPMPAAPTATLPAPPPPRAAAPAPTPATAPAPAPQVALPSRPDPAPTPAPTTALPKPEAARPRKQGPAQATGPPPPAARATARTKVSSARCADIIQRVSLGEPLSDAEKSILQRECGP